MSDTPETIDAIIAEMRDFANPRRVGGDLCSNIACPATISIWADRIEAAAEREREINQKILAAANDANAILKDDRDRAIQFANAAPHPGSVSWKEMHEVYAKARAILSAVPKEGNAAAMREALESAHRTLKLVCEHAGEFVQPRLAEEIIHSGAAVERALAAPERNCDLYPDCNAAWKAYNAIADRERLPGFDFWLFEEAKQEGSAR